MRQSNLTMKTTTSTKTTPTLRFPGFSDAWEEERLGDITSLLKDGSHGSHTEESESNFLLLSAKNIKGGKIVIDNEDRKIPKNEFDSIYKNYSLQKNDLLLTIVGTIGRVALMNDFKNIAFQRSVAFMRFPEEDSYFIFNKFSTQKFQNELLRRQVISAQPGVYLGDLAKIKINLPELEEQNKIADFLSGVDTWIDNLKKQKENLENYKKGMMQKIFSQKIRFKDENGQDFAEWEEKRLGEICEVKGGKRIPLGYSLQQNKNDHPYITVSDMDNNTVSLNKIKYVPEVVLDKIKNYKININDIYVSVAGTLGLVGIIPQELNNANLTENANKLTNLKCSQLFLLNFLKAGYLERLVEAAKTSNAQPKLAIYALKSLRVNLPSFEEQNKIAEFLGSVDNMLELKQKQIVEAEEWKKGLMQGLFV